MIRRCSRDIKCQAKPNTEHDPCQIRCEAKNKTCPNFGSDEVSIDRIGLLSSCPAIYASICYAICFPASAIITQSLSSQL